MGTSQWSWIVAALALLANFFFSGVIFGWAPLLLLLEEDGVYQSLCPVLEPNCDARVNRLIFLYTLGSTACVLGGTPCGFLVDNFGPVVCNIACGVITTAGFLLLGISEEASFDAFAASSLLIGFGGAFVLMTSMPVGFIVPQSHMPLVMSGINCLFDASSVIFLGVYQIYTRTGISRRTIFVGYAALCAALHIGLVIAWSCGPAAKLKIVKAEERDAAAFEESKCRQDLKVTEEDAVKPTPQVLAESSADAQSAVVPDELLKRPPLHGLSLKQQLWTFEFLFLLVFLPIQLFRSNAYLGTNKTLLEDRGDRATDYAYTQIFAASLPASTVCLPLIPLCLTRYGFANTFLLIVALGAAWNAVALVENLQVQLLSFATFTNFRAFLYSVHFVFVTHTFGSCTSARIHGLCTALAALLNFLIWPLTTLAKDVAHGGESGLTYLYALLLLLCMPPFLVVLHLRRRLRDKPEADCRKLVAFAPGEKSVKDPNDLEEDPVGSSGSPSRNKTDVVPSPVASKAEVQQDSRVEVEI